MLFRLVALLFDLDGNIVFTEFYELGIARDFDNALTTNTILNDNFLSFRDHVLKLEGIRAYDERLKGLNVVEFRSRTEAENPEGLGETGRTEQS